MALPSGKGKSIQDLLKLAGFGSYRSYMRAKLIEEEEMVKRIRKNNGNKRNYFDNKF